MAVCHWSVTLALTQRAYALALEPVQSHDDQPAPSSIDERIIAALAGADQPRPLSELRADCRIRNTTLYGRLAAMTAAGVIAKSGDGYHLASR